VIFTNVILGGLVAVIDKPPRYRSYVLTLWQEPVSDPGAQVVWRFSLKDPRTNQRHGFTSLEEMVAFLRLELVSGPANGSGL
jgi:hypothetical protein